MKCSKRKRKNENENKITYDEVKDAYIFDGYSVHSERLNSGRYILDEAPVHSLLLSFLAA